MDGWTIHARMENVGESDRDEVWMVQAVRLAIPVWKMPVQMIRPKRQYIAVMYVDEDEVIHK